MTLESYAKLPTDTDWSDADLYRAIVVNLPRRLHDLDPRACAAVLKEPPPLTNTPWDALLAAVAEHTALRDGHGLQPWMDEPQRFLRTPWFANTRLHHMRWEALWHSPGAFLRHGTPVHPSDLDARGGDVPWDTDA